jgi:hypothetical protein
VNNWSAANRIHAVLMKVCAPNQMPALRDQARKRPVGAA